MYHMFMPDDPSLCEFDDFIIAVGPEFWSNFNVPGLKYKRNKKSAAYKWFAKIIPQVAHKMPYGWLTDDDNLDLDHAPVTNMGLTVRRIEDYHSIEPRNKDSEIVLVANLKLKYCRG